LDCPNFQQFTFVDYLFKLSDIISKLDNVISDADDQD